MLTKVVLLLVAFAGFSLAQYQIYQLPTLVQPAPRQPVSLSYNARNHVRPVISYDRPTQVTVPVGTLRLPYAAAAPSGGIVVGNYYHPVVQSYQQQTARVAYQPIESHGYHIGFR